MSLDFLTPSATTPEPARGPLLDPALAAGAATEARDGWELVTSFGDPAAEAGACAETVGFADRSHLAKLELQGDLGGLVEGEGGESTPARSFAGGLICPLAPNLAYALGAERAALTAAAERVRITDLTAALGAVTILGPAARDTFARFCALDTRPAAMPVGSFRPVSVARTPGFVLREDEERFLMLFGAALGEYVWQVLADAAGRLGGRPVGLDALPALNREPSRA